MITKNLKKLEKIVIDKYEDLLDTIMALEAIKVQTQPGKEWKVLKKKSRALENFIYDGRQNN